ncbi:hypothetical protein PGTUg99_026350 [Puccinia graminis f. sp. tritici]|uniref:Trehalose-phosphatase n=1 Tax=Puccinia graminis f. sp. tritici TaxID=56615 RepID=A0A5B0LWY4_PUCGR|nr:hypothetical protein PGTUg99_026350 [Puccinia graminis f. sp. tritici]
MVCSNLIVLALINLIPALHGALTQIARQPRPIGQIPSALDHVDDFARSYLHSNEKPYPSALIVFDNNDPEIPGSGPTAQHVAKAKELLTRLASDRNNCVWVITARNPTEMKEYDSIAYLKVGSEHGAVARLNKGDKVEQDDFAYPEARLLRGAISRMAERHGVKITPKPTLSSAAFTYAGNDPRKMDKFFEELNAVLDREEHYSAFTLKELPTGVVLISNPSQNKGPRLEKILSEPNHRYEFGITFGDKQTDEAMHELMEGDHFYSVVVGANMKHSIASHRLENTEEVHRFMMSNSSPKVHVVDCRVILWYKIKTSSFLKF